MNSKRKGSAGERELCEVLKAAGYLSAHRNEQRYVGGVDHPDIALTLPGGERVHVECKRTEKLSLYEAFEQAEHDANGHAVPVVMHRRSRCCARRMFRYIRRPQGPWLCVMKLEDWLKLVGRRRA